MNILVSECLLGIRCKYSGGSNPCLAVILVGENPASQVYVRGKINDCAQCGIESRSINLPADTTQEALLAEVKKLAEDAAVHGILVQLPLPAQIDEKAVIDAIPPEKDVDGFSPVNVGRMQIGEPCYLPCTPAGCIRMIESTGTEIAGKNAVVIGRSNIVGKPAALLLGYPVNNMTLVKGAYRFLQDPGIREPRYYTMNVSDYVTDDFPATYHWHGKDDITLFALNAAQQEPVLEAALAAHNVPHKYIVYDHAPHVSGIGTGTDADGWLYDAAAFWEEQVAQKTAQQPAA